MDMSQAQGRDCQSCVRVTRHGPSTHTREGRGGRDALCRGSWSTQADRKHVNTKQNATESRGRGQSSIDQSVTQSVVVMCSSSRAVRCSVESSTARQESIGQEREAQGGKEGTRESGDAAPKKTNSQRHSRAMRTRQEQLLLLFAPPFQMPSLASSRSASVMPWLGPLAASSSLSPLALPRPSLRPPPLPLPPPLPP